MSCLIRSVNGQRTVYSSRAHFEKSQQSDTQSSDEVERQPNTEPPTSRVIREANISNSQQPKMKDNQPAQVQHINEPNEQASQPPNIREELIEALKGLTIKLEIRLSDVIDASSLNCVSNGTTSESESSEAISTSDESRGNQASNGFSKTERSSNSNYSGTTDSEAVLQTKIRPKLVDDFKSKIRPITSLKSNVAKASSTVNFTPLQVLRKQAEKCVGGNQNAATKPKRPIFIEPIGGELWPKSKSSSSSKMVQKGCKDKKSDRNHILHSPSGATTTAVATTTTTAATAATAATTATTATTATAAPATPATTATTESISTSPADMCGKLAVGTVINSCRLSSDDGPLYITYSNDAILELDKLISEMAVEIETLPRMREINVHDSVFAKSLEGDIWYRAKVTEVIGTQVHVFYVDWGLSELLPRDQLRYLSISRLSLAVRPACAIKAKFTTEPPEDRHFSAKVLAYNQSDNTYTMTFIG